MIGLYVLAVLSLLVLGAFRSRFQQATLHWGRSIADLDHVEREIQTAKKGGSPALVAELLGHSVHKRGFQDAITPPQHMRLTMFYWIACIGVYILGFSVLSWYIATAWPVLFVVVKRALERVLPEPSSDYYRQKITASLSVRRESFKRTGDDVRADATEHMLALLRQDDHNA